MTTVTATPTIQPLETQLSRQIDRNDMLLSADYLAFQSYLDGQTAYMRMQPLDSLECKHARRGWLDANKYDGCTEEPEPPVHNWAERSVNWNGQLDF